MARKLKLLQLYKKNLDSSSCLNDNALACYGDGHASPLEVAEIEKHLSRCDECNEALSEFARGLSPADGPAERYQILELVGRGTMGAVFRAHDSILDRSIALKFLQASLSENETPDTSEALRGEALTLAKLSHPNVVSVYELGILDGQSYAAMEFVRGKTLSGWIEAENRSWQEVLEVMVQAGRGIQAAHEAGVVHRDIKPSNILVGDDGRVRVVDFGLARVQATSTAKNLNQTSTLTSLAGTPAYLAPELKPNCTSTPKSDQYSFCVTVHEALTGKRPKDFKKNTDVSVPEKIMALLERGLANSPNDRHENIQSLLDEMERLAAPRVLLPWLLAGGAALASLVLIGMIFLSENEPRATCNTGPEKLKSVWGEVQKRAVETHINSLSSSLAFVPLVEQHASEWLNAHRETCLDNVSKGAQSDGMMNRRMLCLDKRLAYLGSFVSSLRDLKPDELGSAYTIASSLSDPEMCQPSQRLVDLWELPADPQKRQQVESLAKAEIKLRSLADLGRYAQIKDELDELVAESVDIDYPEALASVRATQGWILYNKADYDGARDVFIQAFNDAEAAGDVQLKHRIALKLGSVEFQTDHFAEAERWIALGQASAKRGNLYEDPDNESALFRARGGLAYQKGDYKLAFDNHVESLRLLKLAFPGYNEQFAALHLDIATMSRRLGNVQDAHRHVTMAVKIQEEAFGVGHVLTAKSQFGLGVNHLHMGQPSEAITHLEMARDAWASEYGLKSYATSQATLNIALARQSMGEVDEAEREFKGVLEIYEAQVPIDPRNVAQVLTSLANLAAGKQDYRRVQRLAERSLALLEPVLGTSHPELAQSLLLLGLAHTELGTLGDAQNAMERSLAIQELSGGKENPGLAYPLQSIGDLATKRGRYPEAIALFERALDLKADDFITAALKLSLSQVLWRSIKDRKRARRLLAEAQILYDDGRNGRVSEALSAELKRWALEIGGKPVRIP